MLPKLKEFLDANGVKYESINHSQAFTSQEIAASAHISGKELAKTVMVRIDGRMAMAILPGSHRVNIHQLREASGAKRVELATEAEFRNLFSDCEPGAMPPFGNLWGLDVYVADALTEDNQICFNAGSHTELVKLAYRDFERLVGPRVLHFAATVVAF
ncbi:MAG: YbaK/EbsC family protein [Gemmatimonadetes bacterium]|nr:YbaK/EbsC family protein [Gemmatimonadota bacterium]